MVERKFTAQGVDVYHVAKWAEKGTSVNQMSISVSISNGQLSMQAYDGIYAVKTGTSVTQHFPDDIRFSVPAPLLMEALKKMEKQEILFSFERTKLILSTKSPRMRYSLPVHVPRTVDPLPALPENAGTVDSKVFRTMIGYASQAVSNDDSIPALSVINMRIEPQNKRIILNSTDRYAYIRRVFSYNPNENAQQESFDIYLKPSTLKNALSNVPDDEEIILYAQPNNNNIFGIGTSTAQFSSLTMNINQAPAYDKLAAQTAENYLLVNRDSLQAALTNIRSATTGGIKIAVLSFDMQSLLLMSDPKSSDSKDVGFEMEVDLVEHNHEEKFEIRVNVEYISKVLRAGKSKNVKLSFNTPQEGVPSKPVLVLDVDDNKKVNENFFSLFMPAR